MSNILTNDELLALDNLNEVVTSFLEISVNIENILDNSIASDSKFKSIVDFLELLHSVRYLIELPIIDTIINTIYDNLENYAETEDESLTIVSVTSFTLNLPESSSVSSGLTNQPFSPTSHTFSENSEIERTHETTHSFEEYYDEFTSNGLSQAWLEPPLVQELDLCEKFLIYGHIIVYYEGFCVYVEEKELLDGFAYLYPGSDLLLFDFKEIRYSLLLSTDIKNLIRKSESCRFANKIGLQNKGKIKYENFSLLKFSTKETNNKILENFLSCERKICLDE